MNCKHLTGLICAVVALSLVGSPAYGVMKEEVANSPQEQTQARYLKNRIIVKFKPNQSLNKSGSIPSVRSSEFPVKQSRKLLKRAANTLASSSAHLNRLNQARADIDQTFKDVYILDFENHVDAKTALAAYQKSNDVEYATLDYIVEPFAVPDDPYYHSFGTWGQNVPEGPLADLWGLYAINTADAWDITTGSEDVVIAVVDTGVDYNHPDIVDNLYINDDPAGDENGDGCPGVCGVDDDGDGLIDEDTNGLQPGEGGYSNDLAHDDDENGYVDDTIGYDFTTCDRLDFYGILCIAPKQRDNDPMDGYGHGTHVAGTIAAKGNNGIGMTGVMWNAKIMPVKIFSDSGASLMSDIVQAIIYAGENGAHIMNHSWGVSFPTQPPPILKDAFQVTFDMGVTHVASAGNAAIDIGSNDLGVWPAALDTVISVAASTQYDERTFFSNYGNNLDVSAPGGGLREDPLSSGCAPYYNILALKSETNVWNPCVHVDDEYVRLAGTSMASPHVAGLAGLLLSQFPDINSNFIRIILRASADDIELPGKDVWTGFGRVNARRALDMVQEFIDTEFNELSVKEFTSDLRVVKEETPVLFTVTVKNNGLFVSENVHVVVREEADHREAPLYQWTIPTIAPNEEVILTTELSFVELGNRTVEAVVNPQRFLEELTYEDNLRTLDITVAPFDFEIFKYPSDKYISNVSFSGQNFVFGSGDSTIVIYNIGDDLLYGTSDDGGEFILAERGTSTDSLQFPTINGNKVVWHVSDFDPNRPVFYDYSVYDLGPDGKPNTLDDRGPIRLNVDASPTAFFKAPTISEDQLLFFGGGETSATQVWSTYHFGPDGLVGTSDDVGPTPVPYPNVRNLRLSNNTIAWTRGGTLQVDGEPELLYLGEDTYLDSADDELQFVDPDNVVGSVDSLYFKDNDLLLYSFETGFARLYYYDLGPDLALNTADDAGPFLVEEDELTYHFEKDGKYIALRERIDVSELETIYQLQVRDIGPDNIPQTEDDLGRFKLTFDLYGIGVPSLSGTNVAWSDRSAELNIATIVEFVSKNRAPALWNIGDKTVVKNFPLEFELLAIDRDSGESLTFFAENLPGNSTLTDNGDGTALFSWRIPTEIDEGDHTVTFSVMDNSGAIDSETITISVTDRPNTAPVLEPIDDVVIFDDQPVFFTITANDAEDDPVTFSSPNLPEGAYLGYWSGSGHLGDNQIQFIWTYDQTTIGEYDVTIAVTDDRGGIDHRNFHISVLDKRSPYIEPIGNANIPDGTQWTQDITVLDRTSESVTIDVALASGRDLDSLGVSFTQTGPKSARLQWTPVRDQVGTYSFIVTAVDESDFVDTEEFVVRVENANQAPVIEPIDNRSELQGEVITIDINATDPDDEPVEITFEDELPIDAVLTVVDGQTRLVWNTLRADFGTYHFTLRAEDDEGLFDTEDFSIQIREDLGYDKAVRFNGNTSVMSMRYLDQISRGRILRRAVGFWFKADNVNTDKQVLFEEGGVQGGMSIYLDQGKLYAGAWDIPNGWQGDFFATENLDSNRWYHVVFTVNANTTESQNALDLYLDGALVAEGQGRAYDKQEKFAGIGAMSNETRFHDGESNLISTNFHFRGEMDDFFLAERLTSIEVASIANVTRYPDNKMVAYMSFDENSARGEVIAFNGSVHSADLAGNITFVRGHRNGGIADLSPTQPEIMVEEISDERIDFYWTAAEDETNIVNYIVLKDGIEQSRQASRSFTDMNLTPATQYTYTVIAYNPFQNQSEPAVLNVETFPVNQPPVVEPVEDQEVLVGGDLQFEISVEDEDYDTHGWVYFPQPAGSTLIQLANTGARFRWTPTPAQVGEHVITFRLTDGGGNVVNLPVNITVLEDTEPPTQPTNLNGIFFNDVRVRLDWTPSTDNSGNVMYNVYRDGEFIGVADSQYYIDDPEDVNVQLSYYVIAFDGQGNQSEPSNTFLLGPVRDEKAVFFLGVNSAMQIPNSPDINLGTHSQRTIAFHFKMEDTQTRQVLYEEGASRTGLVIYVENGTINFGGWNRPSGWDGTFIGSGGIQEGQWHHVALVLDADGQERNSALMAYLDGRYLGSGEGTALTPHSGGIGVGAVIKGVRYRSGGRDIRFVGDWMNGSIDSLGIFNSALTLEDIQTLQTTVINPANYPGLVAYYEFYDNLNDTSVFGQNNDGTAIGAVFYTEGIQ